ncbi:unnamed protein product [Phyllotreta striolata]|uniref:Uncharacterized protein n=1 Tax=Phyllotreta striolata TaxID=444603 RepID=A0A9N9XN04_PHYSR|nr:unnamed protein product [Phyllotreta striolata]
MNYRKLRVVLKPFDSLVRRFKHSNSSKSVLSGKLNLPPSERNKAPILGVLEKYFDKTKDGKVLEISSGSGQHVAYFAPNFPKLTFYPSEYEESLMDSIRAYAAEAPAKNIKDPVSIDVAEDWTKWNVPNDFDYAININMIHIAPYPCTIGLFKNMGQVLKPGGLLVTYGPYANNGVLEPQSNRDFDKLLKARFPGAGVRDIQDLIKLAQEHGIRLKSMEDMPANNKCLIWEKIQ